MEYPSILDFLGGQGGRLHKAVGEVGIIHAVHGVLTPNRTHPRSVLGLERVPSGMTRTWSLEAMQDHKSFSEEYEGEHSRT